MVQGGNSEFFHYISQHSSSKDEQKCLAVSMVTTCVYSTMTDLHYSDSGTGISPDSTSCETEIKWQLED